MPTLTFDPTAPPAKLIGHFPASATFAGHSAMQVTGAGWWAANVVGTAATLSVFPVDTGGLLLSVDGGAFGALATTAFSYQAVTLFSGLSDAAHTVVLKFNDLSAIQAESTSLSVTGSAPALAPPTGYNYFRCYDGVSGRSSAGLNLVGSVPAVGAYSQFALDGTLFVDFGVRFRATTTTIRAAAVDVSAVFALTIDGVTSGTLSSALAFTGALDVVTLFGGLDGSNEHEYILTQVTSGGTGYLEGIIVDSLNGAGLAARDAWAFYGDSVTEGLAGTSGNSTRGFAWTLSQANGKECENKGAGGTTVSGGGPTTGAVRTADITGATPSPSKVFTLYGVNDLSASVDATTFGTAYGSMVSALHSGLPSARLYFLSLPYYGDPTLRGQYNAAIQSAVTAASSANVVYVDMAPILSAPYGFNPAGADTADGLHPTQAGYAKIKDFLQATVAPPPSFLPAFLPRPATLGTGVY